MFESLTAFATYGVVHLMVHIGVDFSRGAGGKSGLRTAMNSIFSRTLHILSVLLLAAALSGCIATEYDKAEIMELTSKKKKRAHTGSSEEKEERIVVINKALPKKAHQKYFVEFRSRPNGATSHSYIAYGRMYSRTRVGQVKLVGLHPKNGSVGFLIGSVVGMEAQIKPVWGDLNIPHTISFRVPLDYKQYKKMVAFIEEEKKKTHTWNLVLNNCNGFVSRIADLVGLKSPDATAIPPSAYVESLIEMNT